MLRVSHFPADGTPTEGSPSDLADFLDSPGTTWIDLHAPSEDEFQTVNKQFDWHPLAIDDMRVESHLPKVDDFGEYLLLVVHAAVPGEEGDFDTAELEVFVGRNYLVTHHERAIPAVDRLLERCHRNRLVAARGPAFILYLLLDGMADVYLPYLERVDERIEQIEAEVLEDPEPQVQRRIYSLKQDIIRLRRIVLPQADVVRRLGRGEFLPILPSESEVYFRDVYDHLFRVSEEASSFRERLGAALDSYLSAMSNEMNKVMKVLTVFASIFIPLSFLAGVWGMNFRNMPELNDPYAYPLALGSMVLVAGTLVLYFRHKRWL